MRYKYLVVFCLVLIITGLTNTACYGDFSLSGKMIVIDPGHGGRYPGAVANGLREADVNLTIAQFLRAKLIASGANVALTRYWDQDVGAPGVPLASELQARVDVSQNVNADIFVSIHSNADTDPNTYGTITFYPASKPSALAFSIQSGLATIPGVVDKGIRPANFYVLRNSKIPAALVEVGFITNTQEAARIADDSYKEQLAEGICRGIIMYFQAN